jgi:hypothetical protein
MRATAEVEELAVAVDGDDIALLDLLQPLELVGVVGEQLLRLAALDLTALERLIGDDDLRHPRLDPLEVFRGERLLDVEVVVEALGDRRTEADPRVRPQAANRRGQNVCRRVAEDVERVLIAVVLE